MAETPWSVKGVDRRAREAAKRAARTRGLTLGAWLSDAILERWDDDGGAVPSPENAPLPGALGPPDPGIERRLTKLEHDQTALARDVLTALTMLRAEVREAKADAQTQETCRALGEAAQALEMASRRPVEAGPPKGWDTGLRDMIAAAQSRLDGLDREIQAVRERSGPPAVFEPPPAPRKDFGAAAFVAALILGGVFVSAVAAVMLNGRV